VVAKQFIFNWSYSQVQKAKARKPNLQKAKRNDTVTKVEKVATQ
jgi:hypothetical protein